MANYAHPETLVSTNWVAEHASDPKVRVVEVDVDVEEDVEEDDGEDEVEDEVVVDST